jgi:co-chaperonin GroES (HSP10)
MLHDRVLVKLDKEAGERRSGAGIVIPATAALGKRLSWGEVVGVGPSARSVKLVDIDNATGIVYLSAEHQQHDGTWADLSGAYHDTYQRRDGRWLIVKRKLLFWYRDRYTLSPDITRDRSYRVFSKWPTLPDAWPTWGTFWAEHERLTAGHPSVNR